MAYIDFSAAIALEVFMTRTFRFVVVLGLFVFAGFGFPSAAGAQRRGGGGGGAVARGGTAVHGGGAVVRGGGAVHGGGNVAVPRTHPPYSYYHPYSYYRPYYYHPSYYYPYYSPWSFSLSFGFGWYGGGYYAYPYGYPYAYPPYPYSYPPPYQSQPQYPPPTANNGYNDMAATPAPNGYQAERSAAPRAGDQGEFGTLSLRVLPADATIVIDQQAWDRPAGDERFSIELSEGPHQVEVRKAGFTSYVRTLDVPRGRPLVWNVALTPLPPGARQAMRTVPLR